MLRLTLAILILITCGCDSRPGPIAWSARSLSPTQEARQETLLREIHGPLNSGTRDCLDGVPATQHAELFALADSTGVRGDEQFYKFNVLMEGDVHDAVEMIIIVRNGMITFARWPFAEF